ncbi:MULTISPECIES: FtsH protease activity modulator HflK [unclassified Pseudomonas]|uniref:FtsH protease activity modulator HflK n=1 Tax=unclassified Pseudomonas TaxID=196821 RepID=UPI002AC93FC4|nr:MULTISPECIES: FtsH protease activity modulator HflK [unclassified Pseudomonas]MEB0046460.1 FtsH protease activity modulator HflK [Pseudomonas sp. Dout3]MEB0097886.1 FtsH protease activity modulator HflK [Pseudomonas sp. DC1.2]WPX59514.1 FtsH protease activity modulator HflK [Pseudomonas sp. DC1.2]
MTDSPAFVPAEPSSPMGRLRQRIGYDLAVMDLGGRGLALIGGLMFLAWISSGIYKVQPDEQGIVLRFGRWQQTAESGLHYHLPFPIETVLLPKITQVNQLQLGSGSSQSAASNGARDKQMLTGDENIVEADCTVFWRIKDARLYLFKISDPERSVKLAAESALREVIGRTPIQAVMSDKRAQIADETRDLLQQLLDREQAGILITQVQLQRVDPPPQVIDAFNDVQRARADQERARNEAEAYANDVIPRARGDASRITQEAEAYKAQVGNLAEGEAKRFLSVYNSYVQSKDVTAWRLYMESMDEVLKKASRVIIDSSGKGMSGVVPYMPLSEPVKTAAKEVRP